MSDKIETDPEMNDKIVGILRLRDDQPSRYAARLIIEQREKIEELQAAMDAKRVYTIQYSNYFPREVLSLWKNEEDAEKVMYEADGTMLEVGCMYVWQSVEEYKKENPDD